MRTLPLSTTHAIATLMDLVDTYLAGLPGPGAADVVRGLRHWRKEPPATVEASWHPSLDLLPAALSAVRDSGQADLADAIEAAAPALAWAPYSLYPIEEIGRSFAGGHAFATLIGEGAPYPSDDFDLGLFLIAPGVFYRDHQHAAPELYAPLTGPHGWRFRPGDPLTWHPAHHPVWNDAWQPHATKVGAVPFLCLYGWTRDVAMPARVIAAQDWPDIESVS
jgi:hypothetical protein